MSTMPLLPTRLVSNIKFRIYTKKGVGVIHLCSSRRSSSSMLPSQDRETCRGPRIYGNIPCATMDTTGELSLYAGIYCGFS